LGARAGREGVLVFMVGEGGGAGDDGWWWQRA
jgi:hypothetical protein